MFFAEFLATAGEAHAQALMAGDAAVHRVGIAEVVGERHRLAGQQLPGQFGQARCQGAHQRLRACAGNGFVVMPRVVVAAVAGPVFVGDLLHALPAHGQDVQPQQHGPDAVLFADVVAAE